MDASYAYQSLAELIIDDSDLLEPPEIAPRARLVVGRTPPRKLEAECSELGQVVEELVETALDGLDAV